MYTGLDFIVYSIEYYKVSPVVGSTITYESGDYIKLKLPTQNSFDLTIKLR